MRFTHLSYRSVGDDGHHLPETVTILYTYSAGVFESEVNEVRSRTMLRVQMYQELSTTSMRLPDNLKEVKPVAAPTLANRLDRMCQKVISSIDEPKKAVARPRLGGISRRMRTSHFNLTLDIPATATIDAATPAYPERCVLEAWAWPVSCPPPPRFYSCSD